MTKASSSREQFRFLKEVNWGVIPAVAMTDINVVSDSLNAETSVENSAIIRSDTNRFATIRTGRTAPGDLGFELQFGGQDFMLEGAFRNTFGANIAISATTIDASAVDNSFNDSANGFVTAGVTVGQTIRVSGFVNAANNGYFKVISVTAAKIVVSGILPLVTEAAGPTVLMNGQFMKNLTVDQSFTIEKEASDISQFIVFTGMRVGSFTFTAAPGSIITGTTSFQGKDAVIQATTAGTGASTAAVTTTSMNAVDNILEVREGGALAAFDITNLSLSIGTGIRDQQAIGNLTNVGIGTGTIDVSGTLTAYFESAALYQKYLSFADTSLSFITQDAAGNAYIWDLPKVKYTAGTLDNPGIDNDLFVDLSFTGEYDPTTGATILVNKISA